MRYRVPTEETRRAIEDEFRKWRKESWADSEISDYEIPLRLDRSQTSASVRFVLRGIPVTIECSSQEGYRDNLRCIFYAIEAMRMNEKRGIADTMKNAYLQLAAPTQKRDPYAVLGVRPDTPLDDIKAMYLVKAKRLHSDVGGKGDAMKEVNEAWAEIQEQQ
jgi:hypothetical protein